MFQQCGRVVRVREGEEEGHSSPWAHDQTLCTVSGRQAGRQLTLSRAVWGMETLLEDLHSISETAGKTFSFRDQCCG